MANGLALVWVSPERNESGPPGDRDTRRFGGNGHPVPSTIMVVEDEVLIRLSVSDFLRECGYRVLEAATGEEAQAIFSAGEPIEILFSDIDLGRGINGFVLATWVRKSYRQVRIVLTSGVARMAEEATNLCDGPLLQKPYSYEALADHIKRLLAQFGRQTG